MSASKTVLSAPPDAVSVQEQDEQRVFRKIAWRILPLLTLAYIVNFLDRTNVGFAALTMNQEIGLTAAQFGTGAGILFLGYCVFEVPSNVALHRYGARLWLCRIMVTWGIVSMATIFVTGPKSFYLLRFLLGVAEAGFFPGVAFYLSQWFPAQFRARVFAWFLIGIPASSLIGGPLSGALLEMHGIAGIAGWKWLYLLEGAPAVILGLVLLGLKNRPEEAEWLTAEEKRIVRARLDGEKREQPRHSFWAALADRRVILLALIQFTFTIGAYGVAIFLPLIIKAQNFSDFNVGLISALPSLVACVAMVFWAGVVDRSRQKMLHLAAMCLISALGLVLAVYAGAFVVALAGLTAVVVGTNTARAVLWTIPTRFLTGIAAAGGLAFINSVGTIGGFVGPSIMGEFRSLTGSFNAGLLALAGFMLVSVALILVLRSMVREQ
ncbi:MFS transporter [Roseomonas elaeocarpi]|uniref:MFS transporter n=1 Tax=Roseomonas elaeocarpi TaxID=907779 RepID=A0ABV6JMX5_9PROT